MKDIFIEPAKQLAKERRIITALSVFVLLSIIFCIYVILNIEPSELKLVTHYTAFGTTNFYRDVWYYLVTFIFFGVAVLASHILITLRILVIKGSELAAAFVWLSVVIIVIAFVTVYQVLRVAALA